MIDRRDQMTKKGFLEKLKAALDGNLSGAAIQDQIAYYKQYIEDEVRKGRTEEAVVEELGDPWAIARTITDSAEMRGETGETFDYEPERRGAHKGGREQSNIHVFGIDTWWKRLLFILGIAGIFLLVIAVVGGIFSLLLPVLIPLVLISLIFRLLDWRR